MVRRLIQAGSIPALSTINETTMNTIKLKKHITIDQMIRWKKMGVEYECNGFNFYAFTDDATVVKIINEANSQK